MNGRPALVVALAALALVLAACGGEEAAEEEAAPPAATEEAPAAGEETEPAEEETAGADLSGFRFGVILPTSASDLNWSQTMHDAAEDVAAELGVDVSMTDNVFDPTAARPLLEQLLGQDTRLILPHSFSYAELVQELAPQNPDTVFVVAADGVEPVDNMSISTFSYLETGYSQCWLAARVSESGIIGNVGAAPVPYNVEVNEGCQLGAEAANPDARVIEAFTNDFADQQKGREVAQSLIDQGADAIFVSGGTDSSLGALALCGQRNVPCYSTSYDNRSVAPNAVVSSTWIDWRPFLRDMVADIASGEYEPFLYNATLGNGGLAVTPFDGPSAEFVSEDVQAEFDEMLEQLASEEIELPESTAHPGYR